MRLVGRDGDSLEIDVVRYQFRKATDDYHDSNWLVIRTSAANSRGSWTSEDPSFLTGEISALATWLEDLAVGQSQRSELDFTEPNLAFELVEADNIRISLRVWFELESRPQWAKWNEFPARDLCVDLNVTKDDLRTAAESLRADLGKFPVRPSRTDY